MRKGERLLLLNGIEKTSAYLMPIWSTFDWQPFIHVTSFFAACVVSVWPSYGPLAGGTRVTITGQRLNSTVRAVLIGYDYLHPHASRSPAFNDNDIESF